MSKAKGSVSLDGEGWAATGFQDRADDFFGYGLRAPSTNNGNAVPISKAWRAMNGWPKKTR